MAVPNALLGGFGAGFNAGNAMAQNALDTRRRNQFAQLASQAYGADPQQQRILTSQVIAQSPEQGFALGKSLQADEQGRNQRLGVMARALTRVPEHARPGLYQQMKPELSRFGLSQVPEQYTPEVGQLAEQLAAAIGGGDSAAPAGYRQFEMMAQAAGLQPGTTEYQQAANIALGREGRASSAGFQQMKFTGPDGRERVGVMNGRTGRIDLPDGTSFDPQTGSIAPTQQMAPGEVPFSIDPSLPPEVQASIRANPQQWATAPEVTITPGLPAPRSGAGNPFVSRSPEEQAAATTAAQQAAELQFLPTRQAIETAGAVDRAREVSQAEYEMERDQKRPQRIAKYEQALEASSNVLTSIDRAFQLISPMSTGFIGARMRNAEGYPAYNLAAEIETVKSNLGFDRLQEMRDNSPTGGALGQVAVQELVALQSTVANLDPDQSAEQLQQNLQRVQQHYQRWQQVVRAALADEQRAQPASPAPDQPGGYRVGQIIEANGRRYRVTGGDPNDPDVEEVR